MKTVPLNCNHCGAPLRVQESARFVTCSHCHSQLAIHYEDGAIFTEVLAEISARTQNIESEIQALRTDRDLERLDEQWEKERREILGGAKEPADRYGVVLMGGLLFCCGVAALIYGLASERGQIVLGLGMMGISVVMVLFGLGSISLFEEAQARYSTTRRRILNRGKRGTKVGECDEAGS